MTLEEARKYAAEAKARREANPGYVPSFIELRAIDVVLIDQARKRLELEPDEPENNSLRP
jgi:hypothetical protein